MILDENLGFLNEKSWFWTKITDFLTKNCDFERKSGIFKQKLRSFERKTEILNENVRSLNKNYGVLNEKLRFSTKILDFWTKIEIFNENLGFLYKNYGVLNKKNWDFQLKLGSFDRKIGIATVSCYDFSLLAYIFGPRDPNFGEGPITLQKVSGGGPGPSGPPPRSYATESNTLIFCK